ncbi:MAG: CoA activase [candidate division Zixibacteria bacterium]|nr:CoA activase [candidate division Zixibacteria bacterium]
MDSPLYIGLDIGSVSVNAVVLDKNNKFLYDRYIRIHGRPLKVVADVLEEIQCKFPAQLVNTMALTGSGAELVKRVFGGRKVNEVIAQAQGTLYYHPEVRAVIEMGGEDSKLIILSNGGLSDFSMNSLCAAGTGSFLDQQAARLRISIEGEFGEMALKSTDPPRIAGRCSVFAKSDMIHLQQIATPDYDIVAGLCFAMARNFKGTIARGRILEKPVSFQGGVAANLGMVRAIREIFELGENELVIPERHTSLGAAGAVLTLKFAGEDGFVFPNLDNIMIKPPEPENDEKNPRLEYRHPNKKYYSITKSGNGSVRTKTGYLGVDVGSLSTNLVVIDGDNNVLAREYLMTEGRPLDAVCRGIKLISESLGEKFDIKAAGTTGSGRYLTGDFLGADVVKNEITCQATAAIALDPEVDTIFEIGGQDSKYVSIDNGVVVDFEMNKACAAGTGSFLQEQAEKLNININEEFADLALKADCPVGCGERCTVFMESDLVGHQQAGADTDDLVAGLAYSIVYNYLNKVVADRRIGNRIFFQGGVAWNRGVVAAFENALGKEIIVPPHHDVTGAIGAAIIARDRIAGKETGFKGFGIHKKKYTLTSFTCDDCPNSCHIHKVEREGDEPLYYGSRCEKYESGGKPETTEIDTVAMRNRILFKAAGKLTGKGKKILFPMALSSWELYPLWSKFFTELGHRVTLSGKTSRSVIHRGCDIVASETCFPVKIAHGHISGIDTDRTDYIFVPAMISMPRKSEDEQYRRFFCPYVQSLPYVFKAAVSGIDDKIQEKIISADIELDIGTKIVSKRLAEIGKKLGNSRREVRKALESALECYDRYREELRIKGEEFLKNLPEGRKALALIGRPYNVCDYGANMELPDKIRQLGVPFLPMDFLPLDEGDTGLDSTMYWNYGRKILAAAEYIKEHPQLYAVYLTNFGCGPDSFISHRFREIMDGKPYLQLEIDEHSADAGFITRIEAFLDHLKGSTEKRIAERIPEVTQTAEYSDIKVYIPYMCDHAFTFASAFKYCGIDSEVMPESSKNSYELGRKYTSGRECFPAILTTGDLVSLTKEKGFVSGKSAFFMPTAGGPCRFGQYHLLHRKVLNELGLEDMHIYSPTSNDSYSRFIKAKGEFRKIGYTGFVAVDHLQKMLHHCRPYEREKGLCDRLYKNALNELCKAIETGDDPLTVIDEAAEKFASARNNGVKKPLVGVVGEIYIRNNRFANSNLIRKLEDLGCEVYLESMAEWILFVTHMYNRSSKDSWDIKGIIKSMLTQKYQYSIEHRYEKALKRFPDMIPETPVEEIVNKALKYLRISVGGESILSIGKGIDLIDLGASGIVNAMPFTCMPGNVITAISKRIKEDYPSLPWLNVSYEGQDESAESIRLEAFAHQVKEIHQKKTKS